MGNIDDTHKIDGKEPTYEDGDPFNSYEQLWLKAYFVRRKEFEEHKLQNEEEFTEYIQKSNEVYKQLDERLQKTQMFITTLSKVLDYMSKYVLAGIIGYFLSRILLILFG